MTNLNPASSLPADLKQEMQEAFGLVPSFALAMPAEQTRLWWAGIRDFQVSDKTALSPKVKELIGLGVAAQIPCHYCVVFHTEAARLNGASEQELQEAIFMASLTRQGSTILNGVILDEETFDREMKEIVAYAKQQAAKQPQKTTAAVAR